MARNTLLSYPDFNKTLEIHTDANAFQLGVVISQKGNPITLYSKKLTDSPQQYTLKERELLIIIETLKEFISIIIGQKLRIYTNHKNLTCKNFNTNRVFRWRLILKEYGPDIEYIIGEKHSSRRTINISLRW